MPCEGCKHPTANKNGLLEAAKKRARAYGEKHGIHELIITTKQGNYGFQTVEENAACGCPVVDRVFILR